MKTKFKASYLWPLHCVVVKMLILFFAMAQSQTDNAESSAAAIQRLLATQINLETEWLHKTKTK